jgi:nitroreductase / dihydropteridine reductase
MDLAALARTRHTCKAYDPNRRIAPEHIDTIRTLLRHAPSSVNSQPWHFIIAATAEGKARIAKATAEGPYAANAAKVTNASHVIVCCARTNFDDARIAAITDQEERDGRFASTEAKAAQQKGRSFYVNLHRNDRHDTQHWMEKQIYLALGTLLLGAAALGIDATPIEGFDAQVLNAELALDEKALTSVVLVALGYRSTEDFNAALPKSRFAADEVFSAL